ncbi:MAG: UDP-N-acetylmuramoyl-tripeptide--D-alanyl-D-alanine ligase [Verrucomicrobiae bacterium]|nr:UDP-N-acetylmuramoyl-tripeptide--D-alanyl-D-alanine ligase [Verrucomicrobiae bacterium]
MEMETVGFVMAACAGELIRGSPAATFSRINTDSRSAQAGDLFIALKGEHFDGHNYLNEVVQKGAAAVLVESGQGTPTLPDCVVIQVANTRQAYGQIGMAYRKKFSLPVIAVGGSNGKTTTKELIAAVLRQRLHTLWSEASFNNDIGVPATLLRLDRAHQVAILEVGTNHPGELAGLVELVKPRYGVITNIGREHLEFFGNLAGVAEEEGALAEALPADGRLFLNGDDEWSAALIRRTRAAITRVGAGPDCDWRVSAVKFESDGTSFTVTAPEPQFSGSYRIGLLGRHQVSNALFAIALGAEFGLSCAEIARGLADCVPAKMRLQRYEAGGVQVLDDAYNANADSMIAALRVLQELPCAGRRVAVLGDMAELGVERENAHAEVGRYAAELGVEQLIAVGEMAGVMGQAARHAGLGRVIELANVEAAAAAIKSFLKPGDTVLLKASRSTRLERIAQALKASESAKRN